MNLPQVRLRAANEEDVKFIFNSWLKSYRGSTFARPIENPVYFAEQHRLIEKLVKQSTVIVACNDSDSSQMYGWICAQKVEGIFCLHFMYIKQAFRKMGIGRLLFNSFEHASDSAGIYTHQTRIFGEEIAKRFNLMYHPYILTNGYLKDVKDEENE